MLLPRIVRLFSQRSVAEIQAEITQILANLTRRFPEDVSPTADFTKDLGMSSLDKLELLMVLEANFGVELENEKEAKEVNCVQKAVEFVRSKQGDR